MCGLGLYSIGLLMTKKDYYVVWNGHKPGIYSSWTKCQQQIKGFPNAIFRGYKLESEAQSAYANILISSGWAKPHKGICVDAAYSSKSNIMEYRGVSIAQRKQLFRKSPVLGATISLGEFLALVHALAFCKREVSISNCHVEHISYK